MGNDRSSRPLRSLYEALKTGAIDRRTFLQGTAATGAGLGLATFLANTATAAPGSLNNGAAFYAQDASPAASPVSTATRPTAGTENQTRGEGGEVKVLLWQAPTILNPHNATGVKDIIAACPVIEPLIHYLPDASMIPNLITEIPSVENGQLAADLTNVTFTLLPGVMWSDGEPFSADDIVFTWQWNIDPANESQNINTWQTIKSIEAVDATTAKVTFNTTNPFWFDAFAGTSNAFVLPKHVLEGKGKEGRDAFGLKPIGTGPYQVDSFTPNDQVLYSANPNYREANKPFYAKLSIKGGGDAASAARAVLQTGEYDYAWNLQVEPEVLQGLVADSNPGQILIKQEVSVERINLNFSDPNKDVDGQRSEMNTPHPFFSDPAVRQAFAAAIDRQQITEKFYGETSEAVANIVTGIPEINSPNTSWEFNTDKANKILDDAGWTKDGSSRKKDGIELKVVYATSVNQVRQKTQAVVKKNLEAIGVQVELVQVDAGIYFDSAAGNDQTVNHFYWDLDMYRSVPNSPRPISFMEGWYAGENGSNIAQKSNGWAGQNTNRYNNPDYDAIFRQAQVEPDAETLAQHFIAMNDMIVNDVAMIALVRANQNAGASKTLNADNIALAAFSYDTWNVANWRTV